MFNQKLQIIRKSNSVSFRYLNRLLVVILRSDIHVSESLHVCSADSLNVMRPRTRLKFGESSFSAAAPDAWNRLPTHVSLLLLLMRSLIGWRLNSLEGLMRSLGGSYVIVVRQLVIDSYVWPLYVGVVCEAPLWWLRLCYGAIEVVLYR